MHTAEAKLHQSLGATKQRDVNMRPPSEFGSAASLVSADLIQDKSGQRIPAIGALSVTEYSHLEAAGAYAVIRSGALGVSGSPQGASCPDILDQTDSGHRILVITSSSADVEGSGFAMTAWPAISFNAAPSRVDTSENYLERDEPVFEPGSRYSLKDLNLRGRGTLSRRIPRKG